MKVISLVPSWTETLLQYDVNVTGRTQFCIHPHDKVQSIEKVGGTKQCDFEKINKLNPDFVILDKEENPKDFFDHILAPKIVTHVQDVKSMIEGLKLINHHLKVSQLSQLIEQAKKITKRTSPVAINDLPGIIKWIKRPESEIKKIVYVIWKDPWMCVSRDTYIGSVFNHLGLGELLENDESKYPEFTLDEYNRDETLFLFSSEPYSFAKKEKLLKELNVYSAIIDGEQYSWFGYRSIEFLLKYCSVNDL